MPKFIDIFLFIIVFLDNMLIFANNYNKHRAYDKFTVDRHSTPYL